MSDSSVSAHKKSFEGNCSWTVQSTETTFADYIFQKSCPNMQLKGQIWLEVLVCGTLRHNNTEKAQCGSIGYTRKQWMWRAYSAKSSFSQGLCLNGNANTLKTVEYEWRRCKKALEHAREKNTVNVAHTWDTIHPHRLHKEATKKLTILNENYYGSDRAGIYDNNINIMITWHSSH